MSENTSAAPQGAFFGHPHLHPHLPAPPEIQLRHDWQMKEVLALHNLPLMDLVFEAMSKHRAVLRCATVQPAVH